MFSANFYLATQTGPLARALLACAVGARAYMLSGGTIAPLLREGACCGALHLARGRRGGGTAQRARARRRGAGSGARLARTSGPLRDLTPTHVGHTSCAASPRGTTPCPERQAPPPCAVFWDLDNVAVSCSGCAGAGARVARTAHFAAALRAVARAAAGAADEAGCQGGVRVRAYGNARSAGSGSSATRAALARAGVELVEVETLPQAADTALTADCDAFVAAHAAQASRAVVVVVSQDADLAAALRRARAKGARAVAVTATRAGKGLTREACASLVWSWDAAGTDWLAAAGAEGALMASVSDEALARSQLSKPAAEAEAAALAERVAALLKSYPRGMPKADLGKAYQEAHGEALERACSRAGKAASARALQRVMRPGSHMRSAARKLGASPSDFREGWVYPFRAAVLKVTASAGGDRGARKATKGGRLQPGAFISASVASEEVALEVGPALAALVLPPHKPAGRQAGERRARTQGAGRGR